MAEQQSGLRFDIYERVHLSEGVAGIKELEGIELAPHIQVLPQGDQALLRGNLLLSGTYVDEQDAVNRTLEHLIPVEITLPMNRVQRMEDIAVEIENFDVELLSTRSLNITGVLSLNGLEVVSPSVGDIWGEAEEEVVFVHEVQGQQREPEVPESPAAVQEEVERQEEEVSLTVQIEPKGGEQEEWTSPSLAFAAANPIEEKIVAETKETKPEQAQQARQDQRSSAQESGSLAALEVPEEAVPVSEPVAVEAASEAESSEDKSKEMKIGISGKKGEAEEPAKPFGLTSLLQSQASVKAPEGRQEEESPAVDPPQGEKVEWKRLLASPKGEQKEFKRLRLCIVQKEETLESIAKRYDLNPREIALFNRLGDTDLTEGQIVYIPK
ncbi:LysM peptidoglycan-binding domain-containing protein [Paenibacillus sp. OAS669]|uniref:LysM peptidoglycan-binding domain-containing protein n=1 Tax=Paenibacillus sp. OAS669 TaxID=2663821 RepID=UPI0017896029|nr:LysM peptidoglycan-binding domain-containing protein [Paenibacillus sp. OAS669]MBE1443484.1 stage VI sporulation protein D [Paenibacillus sp. OAS669]